MAAMRARSILMHHLPQYHWSVRRQRPTLRHTLVASPWMGQEHSMNGSRLSGGMP